MWTIWNSLESLTTLNRRLQFFAVIIGALTALSSLFLWIISTRISTLQSQRDAASQSRINAAEKVAEDLKIELSNTSVEIEERGRITSLMGQMHIGRREGLVKILEFQGGSYNESTKRFAKETIDTVARGFEEFHSNILKQNQMSALDNFSGISRTRPIPQLVAIIQKDADLNQVCYAFLALRDATKQHFDMFDIEGVSKWCKEHPNLCK